MSKSVQSCRIIAFSTFFVLLSIFITGCERRCEDLDLSCYQYRDTKELVKFVYDASLIFRKGGLKGLEYIRNNRKLFYTPDRYLYVYDMNGVNIFTGACRISRKRTFGSSQIKMAKSRFKWRLPRWLINTLPTPGCIIPGGSLINSILCPSLPVISRLQHPRVKYCLLAVV
jgi:hypothetical protein